MCNGNRLLSIKSKADLICTRVHNNVQLFINSNMHFVDSSKISLKGRKFSVSSISDLVTKMSQEKSLQGSTCVYGVSQLYATFVLLSSYCKTST